MSSPSASSSRRAAITPLAEAFGGMPRDAAWTQPEPLLVQAATRLCRGGAETSAAPLDAAEGMLERLPADDQIPARLAAALIRLALARRTGDLEAATAAAGRAQALVGQLPGEVHARHPEVQAQVLAARGVVELWAGRLDEAAACFAEGAAATCSGRRRMSGPTASGISRWWRP